MSWPARIAKDGAAALTPRLLAAPAPPSRSDYDLSPQGRPPSPSLRPAAVLMPIIQRPEPTVLFTRRTAHLSRHGGQVSFPGGGIDADDPDPLAAALRETWEETGIAPDLVDPAGFLDTYETGTGFAIVPVVGLVRTNFTLRPNASEVDEVFEVPLAFLLDRANREEKTGQWQGQPRRFYAYTYGRHYIWGATAGILASLLERLG